jgi:hypothetical protein
MPSLTPGLSTSSYFAARQHAVCVKNLMPFVGIPLIWLAPSSDYDRGSPRRASASISIEWPDGHSYGEVHQKTRRAKKAACVIHQTNKLSQIGFADQIDSSFNAWMIFSS